MAVYGPTGYGPAGPYPPAGYAAPPPIPGDPQSLSMSIDRQLQMVQARGAVPATAVSMSPPGSIPGGADISSLPPLTEGMDATPPPRASAGTDPAQGGNITWGLLMDMKKANGGTLTSSEQARYDALMAAANGGQASAPATGAQPGGTDPGQAGNITWGLLMDMKKANGGTLTEAEQARYNALMAAANGGQATAPAGGSPTQAPPSVPALPRAPANPMTVPTDLGPPPNQPTIPAPGQPSAPATQPAVTWTQADYDREVRWAVQFEKTENARRYNAYNKEKKIRAGQAEGAPTMNEPQFASEQTWAQQFAQSADFQRYKLIAAEVQRRQAAGERVKPSGMLDKVKSFFSNLWNRITGRGSSSSQSTGAPPAGQTAPAPTSR